MGNYFCIGKTYISLICQDEETATQNLEALNNQFGIEGISKILGNEKVKTIIVKAKDNYTPQ